MARPTALARPVGPLFGFDGNLAAHLSSSAFWSRLTDFNGGYTSQREPFLGTNEANAVGSLILSGTATKVRDAWLRPERAAQYGTFFVWQLHAGRCAPYNGDVTMTISNTIGQGSDALVWSSAKPANILWRCEQFISQFGNLFAIASTHNEPDGNVHWFCMYHPTNTGQVGKFSNSGLIDRPTAIARVRVAVEALWNTVQVGSRRFSTAVVTPPLSNAGGKKSRSSQSCFNIYDLLTDSNGAILRSADGVGMHTYDEGIRWEDAEADNNHSPAHYWDAIKQAQLLAGLSPKHFLMINEGGFDENLQPPPCRTQWNHASDFVANATEEQQGPNHAALLPARRRLKSIRAGALPFWCAYWAVSHYVIYNFCSSGDDGQILCPTRDNYAPREPSWSAYRILCNMDRYELTGPGPWDLTIASKPWADFTNNTTKASVGYHDPLTWIVLANFSEPEKADPNQATTRIYHEWDRANFASNALTFTAPVAGQGNQTNRAGRVVVLPFHGDWKVTCNVSGNTGTARLVVRGYDKYDGTAKVSSVTTLPSDDLVVTFRHRPHDHPAVPNVPFAAIVLEATKAAVFSNVKIGRTSFGDTAQIVGSLVFTTPQEGDTVSGTIEVAAQAEFTNSSVAGVQFQVDGTNLGIQDSEVPYSVSWDTTTASDGQHALSATATAPGGQSVTNTIAVTVMNAAAASAAITSPADGAVVSGTVAVIATASFPGGTVQSVQMKRDGVNLGPLKTAEPYVVNWNTEGVADGPHTLSCIATKVGGGTVTSPEITVGVRNEVVTPGPDICRIPAVNDLFNPFPATAFNHIPIGSGAVWTTQNDQRNVDLRKGALGININNVHAGDMRQASSSDPLVTVRERTSNTLLVTMRMPANWPLWGTTNSGDRPATVHDPSSDLTWQFYHFNRTGTNSAVYDTNQRQVFLTRASGTGSPRMSTSASWVPHCAVAYWAGDWSDNTAAGLPYIEHALHIICGRKDAALQQLGKTYRYPAYGMDGDATTNVNFNKGSIPYGAAFALPMPEYGGPADSIFASLNHRQMRFINTIRRYPLFVVDGTGEASMKARGFGVWTTAMKADIEAAFAAAKPYLRMIENTAQGQTCWGGGTPLAPNCAFDRNPTVSQATFFSASSPWNTPATASVDPNSATMISNASAIGSLKYALNNHGPLRMSGHNSTPDGEDWTVPIFEATTSTPRVPVTAATDWWGGFSSVPIPASAVPSAEYDAHLVIWDKPNKMLYEFYRAIKTGSSWEADFGITFASDGIGYQTGIWLNGARAYGGSAVGGLIRYDEMVAGVIPHALAWAYPYSRGRYYARGLGADGVNVNIASHCDGHADANRNSTGNIPEGARIRLKASVDINARCGNNRACKIIGQALKTYGAFLVDTSGATSIYAEIVSSHGRSWSGLLEASDPNPFTADDFELMSLPSSLTPAP